jgi:hypothetical protein
MGPVASVLLALGSGALGAVLATALAALFDRWREQARLRGEVMLAAVGWADETYLRIIDLHIAKNASYTGTKPNLQPDEYASNSRELRSSLLRVSVLARVAIVYGEGTETALLNQLRANLLEAAQILWRARRENWPETDRQVRALLAQNVDPIRQRFERQLLNATGLPMRWLGLRPRTSNRAEWSTTGLNEADE